MTRDRDKLTVPDDSSDDGLLKVGSVLDGRFEVQRFLGLGGSSEVYVGRQINIDRLVAIKVLLASGNAKTRARFRERFFREAQLAARVKHPSAVTIYDYGVTDAGHPYMVQELLDGVPLGELIEREGPLQIGRAVVMLVRCLDALDYAHRREIVHRDIKPQNLFVVSPGRHERLCILDFGLAFAIETREARLTHTGQINGTPRYLTPEYIQKQIVTPALDIYQIGLTLMEMLTGRPVVDAETPYDCLMAHCTGLLDLDPLVMNTALGPIIERCLHLDHDKRYQHAGELREALESVIDELGVQLTASDSSEFAVLRLQSQEFPAQKRARVRSKTREIPGTMLGMARGEAARGIEAPTMHIETTSSSTPQLTETSTEPFLPALSRSGDEGEPSTVTTLKVDDDGDDSDEVPSDVASDATTESDTLAESWSNDSIEELDLDELPSIEFDLRDTRPSNHREDS